MLLAGIGRAGQERLLAAHAAIIGCGALGCASADLLARAGVGTITLIDRDIVELTNLQRQTLFDERDVAEGMPKAEAARRRLAGVNSGISINAAVADLNPSNAERLLAPGGGAPGGATILVDGTDNFEARYLINDLAVKHSIPYVYAGAVGTHAMQATILPRRTACLRCLFDEPPAPGTTPTCDTVGVLGPLISVIAAHQVTEAIKVIIGREDLLHGALLEVDLWANQHRKLSLGGPRPDCPCCAQNLFEFLTGQRGTGPASLCGQNAVQIAAPSSLDHRLDLGSLAARLAPHGEFRALGRLLVRGTLTHEPAEGGGAIELTVFPDGRAIVKGTHRPEVARSIYAKYVGG